LSDGTEEIKLTTKESELLGLFATTPIKYSNAIALKFHLDDYNYFKPEAYVYLNMLRKHLKDEPGVEIINVHGKDTNL
jgi:DNA-binding response OmpR family regulator